ncbi:MAG: tyrosine-type recombinase/integrase [Anaerolineae bacterium]|nr:tyrosine-type recombinase/integrase [Anaerolineae bacterium]
MSTATAAPSLTAQSSLAEAQEPFREHMLRQGFAENTIKAFLGDLNILAGYLGSHKPVGEIATRDLNDFLAYLLLRRGKPCSPKSYARRVTTLKVFFGWLAESGVLPHDPAAALVHRPTPTPLPAILYDDQVERLLSVTRDLLWAPQPDARPYLLVSLLLQTGIKKSECMGIELQHLDLSNPRAPVLFIRYRNPRMAHKERRLALSPQLLPALQQYLRQYQPQVRLFECTARNLEYVLGDMARLADIPGGVSFEQLRWTAAVRDYRRGVPEEQLRQKLGLSRISWRDTLEKIRRLAAPAL